ncbi:MAG: homoserine O-acetyltransferase [Planctomycetota bacterium]
MPDAFASSDEQRSADLSPHTRFFALDGSLPLSLGGSLEGVRVAYETWGTLNAARDNAILVCHALTGDAHCARHAPDDTPGWWDALIGPGKAIDTGRYFVVCSNVLGSCYGTTGPSSIDPATGRPYGPDFPVVTVDDMVDAQARLIDHLGIQRLFAVVGGSLGGHQAMTWATRYADRVVACGAIATSPRLTAQALAFDVIGRNAIVRDPHFAEGHYYDRPDSPDIGLALARMLGHITYLSPKAMHAKFDADRLSPRDVATEFEKRFSVGSYLAYQGDRFVRRFDANSYMTISLAMDYVDLGRSHEALCETIGRSSCRWLVLSFTSDWLFPPGQSREIVDALIAQGRYVSYCNVASEAGHDAFLLEEDVANFGPMVAAFLDTTTTGRVYAEAATIEAESEEAAASVFHSKRVNYDAIVGLIEPGSSVLDLGCDGGELMSRLAHERHAERMVGVEIDESMITASMRRGFDVVQADLERGLPEFGDGEFDYAVLSLTLPAIVKTEKIVDEMLRVGRKSVVSFPNFGHRSVREAIASGRSPTPRDSQFPHAWWNTPNRRFLSIDDWLEFCQNRGIAIEQAVCLDTQADRALGEDEDRNLLADLAIFVISRR